LNPATARAARLRVIKISGHELADPGYRRAFGAALAALDEPLLVVNGGGKAIADLQAHFDLPTRKVDGLRVTDAQSMTLVEMAMSGLVNKQLVRALLGAGLDAVGLSGVDGGLLRCRQKAHPRTDLGFVGEITAVRAPLLRLLLDQGSVPIVSPVSLGEDGAAYNVNADEGALAIAAALGARQLDFVSNVPGVLRRRDDSMVIPHLALTEAEALIADGTITDGMIPKVRAAVDAVARGVHQARIVNLAGLSTGGTRFSADGSEEETA
jgi:acetylglutamate kinase